MLRPHVQLAGILVLVFLQRVFLAIWCFDLPFDSATVGLMGLHILEGEHPLFLYGFQYSGALLAYLVACSFALFDVHMWSFLLPTLLLTTGWAFATYLLFRELAGPTAGLAAALCVAVPDWITSWYTMAPDCSYSPVFFLGTLSLWLCVRLVSRNPGGGILWVYGGVLGAVAGLGLWTHFLAVAYLAPGFMLVVAFLARHRFRPSALAPFAFGSIWLALFLVPYFTVTSLGEGTLASSWRLHPHVIWLNARILFTKVLPGMVLWPGLSSGWVRGAAVALAAAGIVVYLAALAAGPGRRFRLGALLPLVFCFVFLGLYLPHGMAATAAPRYAIPLWSMALFAFVAVPLGTKCRPLRLLAGLLLLGWVLFNGIGLVHYAWDREGRTRNTLDNYRRVLDHAKQAGTDAVTMVGEGFFQPEGQSLTLLARDRIRFVGAERERYQPAAASADAAAAPAFAVEHVQADAFAQALRRAGAEAVRVSDPWADLFHTIRVPPAACRSIPPGEMRVFARGMLSGRGPELLDRRAGSYVFSAPGADSTVDLDLGRVRPVNGLWLSPATHDGLLLPSSLEVSLSVDGVQYEAVSTVDRAYPMLYRAGNGLFAGGGYGWLSVRFAATPARYLRLAVPRGEDETAMWRANEILVLEEAPPPDRGDGEPARIAAFLREREITFVAADRWLSARLRSGRPADFTYPRHNELERIAGRPGHGRQREFLPGPAVAVAVDLALADDQAAVLQTATGPGLSFSREDFGRYAVFTFSGEPATRPLRWLGFMLAR